jgi:hypothetical protein
MHAITGQIILLRGCFHAQNNGKAQPCKLNPDASHPNPLTIAPPGHSNPVPFPHSCTKSHHVTRRTLAPSTFNIVIQNTLTTTPIYPLTCGQLVSVSGIGTSLCPRRKLNPAYSRSSRLFFSPTSPTPASNLLSHSNPPL